MKRIFCLMVVLTFIASLGFAQKAATGIKVVTFKGDIIDNMCAGSQKREGLAAFVKMHTKGCALMPACKASGYLLYSNGKLIKFDKESNAKIAEFLKKPDSKLAVVAEIKEGREGITLVSIKNQE